jgi:RNA processing factor Prp31
MALLSRKEKEKLVIKLAKEGKTYREIAKIVHMSLKDICKIINKETGDDDPSQQEIEKQLEDEKQKKWKSLSPYAKAFQMFKDKKPLEDVAIELDLKSNAVLDFYNEYLKLTKMDTLVKIYKELGQDFPLFIHLYKRTKEEGLTKKEITEILQYKNKLKDLCYELDLYHKRISELKSMKLVLEQEINSLQE